MDNKFDNSLIAEMEEDAARPDFLKVICIISFVMTGLLLIAYAIGAAACLSLGEQTISEVWGKVLESEPLLADVDPMSFFREIGKLALYCFVANIVSLAGLLMMWNLNRMGFFIYVAAEIGANFLSYLVDLGLGEQSSSMGSLIFNIIIDAIFIVMYALNLKHMKR